MCKYRQYIHKYSIINPQISLRNLYLWFGQKNIEGSFLQSFSHFVRERPVTSFDEVVVESGVGFSRRTDGDHREVQILDGMGGDRGGDRRLLPLFVRLTDQITSTDKSKTNNQKPCSLCSLGLKDR